MSELATLPIAFEADFERFEQDAPADTPSWLGELRRQGFEHFRALGLPTPKNEDWLYTNTAPLGRKPFPPAPATVHVPESLAAHRFALGLEKGPRLVFLNGRYEASLSTTEGLPEAATLTALSEAWQGNGEDLRERIGAVADPARHPFAALNSAFLQDGVLLLLPRGCVVEQPVQVLYLHTPTGAQVAVHPRLLVVAGESSAATIVEHYGIDCIGALAGGTCLTNAVSEYVLGANAEIKVLRLQNEGTRTYHIGLTAVTQAKDSRFHSTAVSLGGAIDRNETQMVLAGEGAECTLNGLYVIAGEEHVDNHTIVRHDVPHCRSSELYKGILAGKARGAFTGKVIVAEHAQKTEATQANHNLLLSRDAVAETRPQLQIYADDVKCAHGATIGQLDAEALFYLRSRGVGPISARNLLVHAFAGEITRAIGDARLTEGLDALLAARLQPDPASQPTGKRA